MIPKDCKRLIEVDFPIAVVSKQAAREKSIRHGHPSTLHLWWARRPLAACRAVLLGLLLPDPADQHCPTEFTDKAWRLLDRLGIRGKTDEDLRRGLLKFIGLFANWDVSSDATFLEVARGLVRAAHPDEPPLVVDPFAGGGSIPLEALRLGCEAFASDLNPVACLILKVMLEDIPRHGPKLAEELRRVGAEIKWQAEKHLADLYPKDPDGATPIAYLWARTVRCESPNCGAEIPLARSFWLCKKAKRRRALRYRVVRGPHPPAPSPTRGEGEREPVPLPSPTWGEGEHELVPLPSPLMGEGPGVRVDLGSIADARESPARGPEAFLAETKAQPDRWEVPASLRQQMVEVARQFRKEPTSSEALLWDALRGRSLDGRKFRRQQPIGPFVVDFFCPEERLIVEVDGPVHATQVEADRKRQELLASLGLRFVRVKAAEVESDLESVLKRIRASFGPPHPPAPSSQG